MTESTHICEHKTSDPTSWSDELTNADVDTVCQMIATSVTNAQTTTYVMSAMTTSAIGVTSLMGGGLGAGFFMLANTFQIL